MTNSKSTKRALLTSSISLLLCFAMLIGTTFAWFTDSASTGVNKIQSGNLDIDVLYATPSDVVDGKIPDGNWKDVEKDSPVFKPDALWEPGYTEVVYFKIKNAGSLALKYIMSANIANETAGINKAGKEFNLSDYLSAYYMTGEKATVFTARDKAQSVDGWASMIPDLAPTTLAKAESLEIGNAKALSYEYELKSGEAAYTTMVVFMPTTVGNEANHNGTNIPSIKLGINFIATQFTYENDSFGNDYDKDADYPEIAAAWDGAVNTSWYNDTDTEFIIKTAKELAGFAELVDSGNTFADKTIKLGNNINLYCEGENGEPVSFDPIGDKSAFEGTFDGNGHTISNLYQSGWAFNYEWGKYGSIGLFGKVKDATIKNVTISGAEAQIEGGDIGGITGSATGTCVFENITIKDSDFGTYNNGIGGIIGWSGAGNYTFKNINIASDVVLGGLWGSFDSSVGGVVGQGEPGATYNFENVDIACRLDVYNDCTASYDYYNYRMCGMIIGRLEKTTTIDGVNYPDMSQYNISCTNVTVTYDDWANYHYCEPTPGLNGGRGMRVEAGYAYDGLPADYDHSQCVDNHMNLIPFDQIFGGDQLGVKGLKSYDGVTVVYNNK